MKCFWCEVELKLHEPSSDSSMSYYWQCPECGGRWFPGTTEETEAEALWNDEQAYKKSLAKKGGGNKKAGRKREQAKRNPNYWVDI